MKLKTAPKKYQKPQIKSSKLGMIHLYNERSLRRTADSEHFLAGLAS